MKKIFAFILFILVSWISSVTAFSWENSLKIEYVDVLSENQIDIYFNWDIWKSANENQTLENINLSKNIIWESSKNTDDTLLFSSENDIENWKYHFLTVWEIKSKAYIDIFDSSQTWELQFISEWDNKITKINLLNPRNIEISYEENIADWTKIILIKEFEKPSYKLINPSQIRLSIPWKFDVSKENIISLHGLVDSFWNWVSLENSIYPFSVWEEILAHLEEEKTEEVIIMDWEITDITLEWTYDFSGLNEVASEITILPETWFNEFLMALVSLFLTILYFAFSHKKA